MNTMSFKSFVLLTCNLLFFSSQVDAQSNTSQSLSDTPTFISRFSGTVRLIEHSSAVWDLVGSDRNYPVPSNWVNDLDLHPKVKDFVLELKTGTIEQRKIQLLPDEGTMDDNSSLLHFWLKSPHESSNSKGRLQGNITLFPGATEIKTSIKMKLSEDFRILMESDQTFTWLTIYEIWNNPNWGQYEYPFRIKVNLEKTTTDPVLGLNFNVYGQIYVYDPETDKWRFETLWHESKSSFPIPVNTWFELTYYCKEGNASEGRFKMLYRQAAQTEELTIFDIANTTRHPDDESNDGIPFFNPMKLYTSDDVLNYVNKSRGVLQISWDDFRFYLP